MVPPSLAWQLVERRLWLEGGFRVTLVHLKWLSKIFLLNKCHAFSKNNSRKFSVFLFSLFWQHQYPDGLSLPSMDPIIKSVYQRIQPLNRRQRGSRHFKTSCLFVPWDSKSDVWDLEYTAKRVPKRSGHKNVNRSPRRRAPKPLPIRGCSHGCPCVSLAKGCHPVPASSICLVGFLSMPSAGLMEIAVL